MKTRRIARQAGLTMIEVMVAAIILSAIVAMSSWLVWSTAQTVSSSEVRLQAEGQAREFFTNLTKELHQTKMVPLLIREVTWDQTLICTTAHLAAGVPSPGTSGVYRTSTAAPDAAGVWKTSAGLAMTGIVPIYCLRFKIPGGHMDLTTKNADVDSNPNNFSLATFKATVGTSYPFYTQEIQYWAEVDSLDVIIGSPNTSDAGPYMHDGVDNNWNGVIDECVIRRMETTYDTTIPVPNVLSRTISTVVRDVQWDKVNNRPNFMFIIPENDPAGVSYAGAEKRIFVSMTLEKADPRHPKDPTKNMVKTVSQYIDVRN